MLVYAALLLAQTATQCTAPAALPPPLAGWSAPAESFEPGKAVTLKTGPAKDIPGLRDGARPGSAAMIGFKITKLGSYGIALDQPGWINVLPGTSGNAPLEPIDHGHGPACSGISKIVQYDLKPGVYRVYLTALAKPEARVMLVDGK